MSFPLKSLKHSYFTLKSLNNMDTFSWKLSKCFFFNTVYAFNLATFMVFHTSVLRLDLNRLFFQVSDISVTSYLCFYISLFQLPTVSCDLKK